MQKFAFLIPKELYGGVYYIHFIDKELKAHKEQVSCQETQRTATV